MSNKVHRLDLGALSDSQRQAYTLLLPPKYRCCLQGLDPDGIADAIVIVIGAEENGQPAGIAVASAYDFMNRADIFWLSITDTSAATTLLETLEIECVKEKANLLVYSYDASIASVSFPEQLFQKEGWSGPRIIQTRCFYDCYTFNPPWFNHPPELPADYKEFLWKDLSPEELRDLKEEYEKSGLLPDSVSPFNEGDTFEPINSIGLRHKGKVIGWFITERVTPDTIKYSALYVQPSYQLKGYSIRLLIDSVSLQKKSPIKWSLLEVNHDLVEPYWLEFVMRSLAPYAIKTDQIFQFWKEIKRFK